MSGGSQDVTAIDSALGDLAWRWATSVRQTSFIELSADRLLRLLTVLAQRLADAFRAEPFSDEAGLDVGRALVAARLASPEALQCSIAVLSGLPGLLELKPDTEAERAGPLLGAVAAGFARASQERILGDQERIRRASQRALSDAEVALRDSEARLRAVFSSAGIAISISDLDGTLLEVNGALADMLGVPAAQLVGRSVFDFFGTDDVQQIRREVYGELVDGERTHVRLEKPFLRATGETGWTMLAVSLVRAADGSPAYLVAMGEDVTERHRLEQELHHQAHHDPLTGLPNRLLLYRHLDETLNSAAPHDRVGVCFLDLDQFKTVNDTLGHGSGDRLLVAVAERLRETVLSAGHFVARVGGDEFVVVVTSTGRANGTGTPLLARTTPLAGRADATPPTGRALPAGATRPPTAQPASDHADTTSLAARPGGPHGVRELAEAMLAALAKPIQLDEHELSVSASIGIVEQRAADADPEELLRAADATLYLAKADGRARYAVFDAKRNAQQLLRYGLTGRLAGALDRGEFELEYQPLTSLVDGRLRGAEALLRWRHPDLGTVSPNTFIPVAEQSGMIHPLGRWVLRESCRQAADWQRRLPHAPPLVSVNVSARQCTDPRLLDDVAEALAESGLAAGNLQVELTETVLMQPTGRPVQTLWALAALGVRIVIDDFGIGYSNFAYLRHLPVHGLKLAGAFMAGIRAPASDRVDEQIVETVIRLAHTLGMTVTAEGVETAEQAARLAALGCDLAQGWHFGRPGSAESIVDIATGVGVTGSG